jgi:hypothetical protein
MSSEEALLISGAVVALTQFSKWAGLDARQGPLAAILLSLLGVLVWSVSTVPEWGRALLWPIFAGWINVLLSSAGVYGYTRAMPEAVSSFTVPPGQGAGSEPVEREPFTYPDLTPEDRERLVELVARVGPRRAAVLLDRERRLRDEGEPPDEGAGRRD